jgi:hypothetical protein
MNAIYYFFNNRFPSSCVGNIGNYYLLKYYYPRNNGIISCIGRLFEYFTALQSIADGVLEKFFFILTVAGIILIIFYA